MAEAANATGKPASPLAAALAVLLLIPELVPSVQVTDACPAGLVALLVVDNAPPPAVIIQLTATLLTALPYWSLTVTAMGCGNA